MGDDLKILPHSGPSWNLSLAEDLKSLSLQDGPRSGIIIGIVTRPPSSRPIADVLHIEYLTNHW